GKSVRAMPDELVVTVTDVVSGSVVGWSWTLISPTLPRRPQVTRKVNASPGRSVGCARSGAARANQIAERSVRRRRGMVGGGSADKPGGVGFQFIIPRRRAGGVPAGCRARAPRLRGRGGAGRGQSPGRSRAR